MKAVLCRAYGEPESLQIGDLPEPALGPGDVRVAVRAVGLNFPDLLMIKGQYQYKSDFPFAPGMECVGEVLEVGAAVSHLRPGMRVIAHPWRDCLAEQVVAPAGVVFPAPDAMADDRAAGFALSHGTVYHALVDRGRLEGGESLLVLGAAGGVGLAAVTMGRHLGAEVIAAAGSAEKLAIAAEHGAHHTIDYTDDSSELRHKVKALTDGLGADVIFDPVGGDMSDQAIRAINWNGRLLIIGFASGRIAALPSNHVLIKEVEIVGVAYHRFCNERPAEAQANMATLFALYEAGALKPHVSATFAMAEAASALRALATRRATGKVVVRIG